MNRLLALTLVLVACAGQARGYIDYNPTLGDVVNASTNIMVVQVDKISLEKQVIIFKKVADLKGTGGDTQKLHVAKEFHGLPRDARTLLDWAQPGRTAIFFHNKGQSYLCLGRLWYESFAMPEPGWWNTHAFKSTSVFAYMGSVDKLRQHVADMVAGKEVVVTALRWDVNQPYQQTAMDYRNLVRSQREVWRIKASTKLYGYQQTISNKANIVGPGAGGADDVAALTRKLAETGAAARLEAAEDLGFIGPAAKAALPALTTALEDPSWLVRVQAATALARIDPAVGKQAAAALLEALAQKDSAVRVAAVEALADIGPPAGQAVPALIKLLGDADGEVRWRAIEALGWMRAEAAPAVPALMELLTKGESETLVSALKRIGPHAKAGVPTLIAMVKQRNRTAADILSSIGPEAKEAVPALIELLKDKELYFTAMVAQALGCIGTPEATAAVVPYCVRILQSPVDASYYQHFAFVLGQLGPKAKEAVPALEAMRKDTTRGPFVEEALRKIGK